MSTDPQAIARRFVGNDVVLALDHISEAFIALSEPVDLDARMEGIEEPIRRAMEVLWTIRYNLGIGGGDVMLSTPSSTERPAPSAEYVDALARVADLERQLGTMGKRHPDRSRVLQEHADALAALRAARVAT